MANREALSVITSQINRTEMCAIAYELHHNPLIMIPIIFVVGIGYYLLGIFNALLLYSHRLIIILLDLTPCAYIMNGYLCYFVASQFSSSCVMGYTIFHGSLLIERLLRTFLVSKRFQWLKSVVVGLMVICLLTLPNVYQYTLAMPSEQLNDRFYCHSPSLLTSEIKTRALQKALTFLICDCCVTVGDVCLFVYNRRQIIRHKRKISGYNLTKNYELRTTEISIRLIFPFAILHSFGFFLQIITNIVFLNKLDGSTVSMEILGREIVNFMRTFSIFLIVGSQLLYYHLRRKETGEWLNPKSGTATETYFEMFRKQLN
ncbi:hypothetical protein M3Y95_01128900 [Aphelenchoides besseyi]|nr:hypothetical protein M3Y95_01128900 [Aphelenchoides besseyi]